MARAAAVWYGAAMAITYPDTKISEALLEFASPLFGPGDVAPTSREAESALKVASAIWNAVAFELLGRGDHYVREIRAAFSHGPAPMAALCEALMVDRRTRFGADLRFIGGYQVRQDPAGNWSVQVEARGAPPAESASVEKPARGQAPPNGAAVAGVRAAKTKKTAAPPMGPIARKVIEAMRRARSAPVVELRAFVQGKQSAEALQREVLSALGESDLHPAHAWWVVAQRQLSVLGDLVLHLPEARPLRDLIAKAEDEYMPQGPPMSPLTGSFFWTWAYCDAGVGPRRETCGEIVVTVAREFGMARTIVAAMNDLGSSRMGLWLAEAAGEGQTADRTRLRELVTGDRYDAICPSGHRAVPGELWYARVLPDRTASGGSASVAPGVVFTTPYVISPVEVPSWNAYLDRTLPSAPADRAVAYAELLKRGLRNQQRYWTEYVFEAYASHVHEAVYLRGVPDIAASRPHSSVNS